METINEYEYKDLRVCEKWLQIESCRKCLFEVLCHYEKMKKDLDPKNNEDENTNNSNIIYTTSYRNS